MTVAISTRRLDLESLLDVPPARALNLSPALRFGLGAGMYFEYLCRPGQSPSRFLFGLNRNLQNSLAARAPHLANGNARQIVVEAMHENALLFNLDRAPTTALLGMEMLAEELPRFEGVADWRACLRAMAREIHAHGALFRELYVQFLKEVEPLVDTRALGAELGEIVAEWNQLVAQLDETAARANPSYALEASSRMLRRLAFREEHFWGSVLDL